MAPAGTSGPPPGPGGRGEILWSPPDEVVEACRLTAYRRWLEADQGRAFSGYHQLWRWSVEDVGRFWSTVPRYFGVQASSPARTVLEGSMPGARWFPGMTLNYAGHALGRLADPGAVAVVARSQTRPPGQLSWSELADQVARCRAGLVGLGVGRGDRVAAYLPNVPEALVLLLACASLGAVFCSCPPEFGVTAALARLGQVGPSLLVAVDGYRYGGTVVERAAEVEAVRAGLPGLGTTVVLPYLHPDRPVPDGTVPWARLTATGGPAEFDPVPFDHPLYVLFTSGTTGPPKAVVHGHGNILFEHLKTLGLHLDLGPGDRFFWFTTTGWMMWNLLVSGLHVGAAVVLFDGDPSWPDLGTLWSMAAETGTTFFGAGAPFLTACRRAATSPGEPGSLRHVRAVGSTGAPLPAASARWVYSRLHPDLMLASISGGTDVCSAFVGAVPVLPVRAGEIACRYLGAPVEAFDEDGRPVVGRQGELVLTAPMPSMPVRLWDDPGDRRYRAAYFGRWPGVWHHGDWITVAGDGSCVISGRSDATLNRGGVRLGTAEFYAVVESLHEVRDSLVVHLEDADGGPGTLALFVVVEGDLDADLRQRIDAALRSALSPRHVPDTVVALPVLPRTLSGKKLEVPVKRILAGTPVEEAVDPGSLADPAALEPFRTLRLEPRGGGGTGAGSGRG